MKKLGCALTLLSASLSYSANAQVQAVRSYDVYDSVGVNTHWYFGNGYQYQPQFSTLVNLMNAAHLRHFRDGVYSQGTNTPASVTQMYSTLQANGIHAELIVPQSTTISAATLEAGLKLYPGVEAIEPPNEWDINGGSTWASTLLAEEPAIVTAGHALGLIVLGPALTQTGSYPQLGNIAQYMDANNGHMYFGGRNPETGGWGGPDAQGNYYGSIPWNLDLLQQDAPNMPSWVTETGSITTSTPATNQIPEWVEGTYAPRVVLELFKRGVKRTYFYELVDDPAGAQPGYGLLRYDLSPKPAFTAIKNLLSILQDDSTQFAPESLNYLLTGNMNGVETLLLEKNAGDFYLAVWLNGSIYDVNSLVSTPIAPQLLTLSIPSGGVASGVYSFNTDGTVSTTTPNQSTYPVNANSCLTIVHISSATAVAAPVISPASGTYTSVQSITISDFTAGAQIRYTTDGSDPTPSSALYQGPISVGTSQNIKAVAIAPGYSNSAIASATYTIALPTAGTPMFSPVGGTYASPVSVTISDSSAAIQIYYTTDGSIPTVNSARYSGAISVTAGQTINAIAMGPGYNQSAVSSATYAISGTVNTSLINASSYYRIINKASGACIDNGGNLTSGAPLTQWQCWPGNKNQQWWFSPTSAGGYYSLGDINTKSTAWTVSGGSTAANAPVQQVSASQARYQQWAPVLLATGYYEFVDANSGMCLNVPGGASTNGLQLQIAACNGSASESFVLGSVSSAIVGSAWYEVINARSGMCLSNPGSTSANATALTQATCGTLLNQEWQLQPAATGYYGAHNGSAPSLVWNNANGSTVNGNAIQLWTWSGNSNQQWSPHLQSNGLWTFTNMNSGSCLDNAGSFTIGSGMTQWSCTPGNTNQQFELVRVR